MSILIKGVNMPQNETYLDLVITADGNVCCYDHEGVGVAKAVELPDHGDLVDRDAFIKVHREYLCTDCVKRKGVKNGRMRMLYEIGGVPCRACGVEDMFEYLDDAPVVIPAERSEE